MRSFVGAPYKSGGKTGTAQAVGIKANEKYNAAKIDEYQRDHSLYIAFAPVEAPTIALAIVVENAGFGSEAAAPITRRVFDYWLQGLWPSEEDMAATQLGKSGAPMGVQRRAVDVPLPGAAASAAAIAALPRSQAWPLSRNERDFRATEPLAALAAGAVRLRRRALAGHRRCSPPSAC